MALLNVDIAIGQIYRSATHVRRFRAAVRDPRVYQHQKLMSIIRSNESTAFGRRFSFDKIQSIHDFQKQVPASGYEDLRPYIDASMNGAAHQLTREQPFMYATTSGTTGSPKFVPITESHLRDYTHAFQIHNYHMIQDYPQSAGGRFLIITSNDEEEHAPNGMPIGAVSGLLNKRQPALIRRHFAVPYEVCKIRDVEAKYYLMLRMALVQDLSAILCCNPSSLMLLADQLRVHAPDLVEDIHDGSVDARYAPPPALADSLAPYLKPERQRAQTLARLLATHGSLTPAMVWPDLAMLSCWKGGPMSFYIERLEELYGQVAVRDFGYMASEGRGSIPLTNVGSGGVLAVTSHFFEFVHEDEAESRQARFLTVDQLEQGRRYYIYFTTAAGLYRYNINDLIEVVGFQHRTPIIQFVRKGLGISSITGEKLTEEQVLVALTKAVHQLNLREISHFTSEVELSLPPRYLCFAELDGGLTDPVKNQFMTIFDDSLKLQNPEYADKRDSRRLGMPALKELPLGTYTRLRQLRVSEGCPEAQIKIPLLSSPRSFSERLALLP